MHRHSRTAHCDSLPVPSRHGRKVCQQIDSTRRCEREGERNEEPEEQRGMAGLDLRLVRVPAARSEDDRVRGRMDKAEDRHTDKDSADSHTLASLAGAVDRSEACLV